MKQQSKEALNLLLHRTFSLVCLITSFNLSFAQSLTCDKPIISNNRIQKFKAINEENPPLLKIVDPYGNEFSPQEITYDLNVRNDSRSACSNSSSCQAGMFTLHFADAATNSNHGFDECDIYSGSVTLGQQRQEVACQVFKDLSKLLHDPNPANPGRVDIWMHSEVSYNSTGIGTIPAGVGGLCQPFIVLPLGINNAIVDNEVWKTIKGGNDSYAGIPAGLLPPNSGTTPNLYHGLLAINFVSGSNYNLNLDVANGSGQTDLYSVILHEAIHALGFYSHIGSTGASKLVNDVFSRYDTYMHFFNGTTLIPLLTFTGTPNNWAYTGGPASLAINCSTTGFRFNGAAVASQPVFSQAAWSNGTNLSHYGCVTGNPGMCGPDYALPNSNFVMNPCMGTGPNYTKRHPADNEVKTLCDLGYRLNISGSNATYGDAATLTTAAEGFILTNYANCSGPCVAMGFSDAYATPYNQNLTISSSLNNVLSNDVDNNFVGLGTTGTINFPAVYTPNAGTITGITSTGFTFDPDPNFTGVAVIGYYPRCSGSSRNGNLTFVFITVNAPPLPPCTNTSNCNLICHGGFELTDVQMPNLFDFPNSTNSPDIGQIVGASNCIRLPNGNQLCTTFPLGCTSGWAIPAPFGAGNTRYVGLASISGNQETVHFRLTQPLLANTTYQLKFIGYNPHNTTCVPILRLFGNNTTPFDAISLGSPVTISGGSTWTPYSMTFTTPASPSTITDVIIKTNLLGTYSLYDNFEILPTGNTQLTITSSVTPATVCASGNVTINYQICSAGPNNPTAIPLQLSIPAGFSITAGSFNTLGQCTIPALGLATCVNLSVTYALNPGIVAAGATYPISLNTIGGTCFNTSTNQNIVNITPVGSSLTLAKSASSPTVQNGTNFTFNFELCNTSPTPLSGIQFQDVVNSNVTIISANSPLTFIGQNISGNLSIGGGSLTAPACQTYSCTVRPNFTFTGATTCNYQQIDFVNRATAEIPGTCNFAEGSVTTRVYSSRVVGSNVGISFLSDAIAQGILLPLSTSPTATQSFTIDGSFTIDEDYYLGWNGTTYSNVYCRAGSGISVFFGKTFNTDHTNYQGCDFMWKGINATGPFWSLPSCTLNIKSCTISDAQYGITCWEGSQVAISSVDFKQCFVGVYFNGNGASATPVLNLNGSFMNNTFSCNTSLFKPIFAGMINGPNQPTAADVNTTRVTWAGMHLDNLSAMNIGAIGLPVNSFTNLSNGIVTNKCSPNIVNSIFDNIQPFNYSFGVKGNAIYCTADLLSGSSNRSLFQRGRGSNTSALYTFNNCTRGIIAEEMHVDVASNLFTGNTNTGIQVSNAKYANILIGLTDGTSNNNLGNRMTAVLENGIALLQNDPVNSTWVSYNDITVIGIANSLMGWGISVTESLNPPVGSAYYHHNKITLNANGSAGIQLTTCKGLPSAHFLYRYEVYANTILMNNPSRNIAGIFLSSCQLVNCHTNIVNSTSPSITSWLPGYPVGYLYQSHNIGRLYCNQNNTIFNGVKFNGTNTSVLFQTHEFGNAGIAGTTVNNHIGLLIDPSSAISPQTHAGNKWYGSYTDRAARNSASSVTGMDFFVNTTGSPWWPNSNGVGSVFPSSLWFSTSSGTPSNICSGTWGAGYKTDEVQLQLDNLEENILHKELKYEAFQNEMEWQNEKVLFNKFRTNQRLINTTDETEIFFESKANTAMEKLSVIDERRENALLPDLNALNRLSQLNDVRDSLNSLLIANDANLTDDRDNRQIDLWKMGKNTITSQIAGIQSQIDQLLNQINVKRIALVEQITADNASTIVHRKIEDNLKRFNNVYLNTVARDIIVFTPEQLSDLYDLAYQCPLEGGEAVVRARSVLSLVNDTFYNDDEICAKAAERYNKEKVDLKIGDANLVKLSIMPNPASSYLQIQSDVEINDLLTATIFDNTGKIVKSYPATLNTRMYRLNIYELPSGLYYLKVSGSSGNIYSGKFSVQK